MAQTALPYDFIDTTTTTTVTPPQAVAKSLCSSPIRWIHIEICRIARRIHCRHRAIVPFEDLVQEGWSAAMKLTHEYDPTRGKSFMAFANARVEGAMIDACRAVARTPLASPEKQTLTEEGPAPAASVEHLLLLLEKRGVHRRALARAFKALAPGQRRLVIRVLQGQSVAEAARRAGVSRTTARYRFDAGVGALRRALKREGVR